MSQTPPPHEDLPRATRALERAAEIGVPCAAVAVLWFLALSNGVAGEFFYDEAVYANLADHPFRSDYYSDPIFFRHPPLVYLLYGSVGRLLPGVAPEIAYRVTSLVAVSAGIFLCWRALRGTVRSLLLRSASMLALVSSSLFIRYSLSATMYPFVFCFLAWVLDAMVAGRRRQENVALSLLIWTHYWGLVMLALHLVGRRVRGVPWGASLRKYRTVLIAFVPIALLTAAGLVYHGSRLDPRHLTGGWTALAFYVPLPVWAGVLYLTVRALRRAGRANDPAAVTFALANTYAFIVLAAVAPPSERYLYAFMPLFFVAGLHGLERMAAAIGSGWARRAAMVTLIPLFLVPSHLCADSESWLFEDASADNNRFQGWREVVDLCHDERVLTNNTRSYGYYLARREGARLRLSDLDVEGRLRLFKGVVDVVEKASVQRPGCIAVDRHERLAEVTRLIDERLDCVVAPTRRTLVYRCRWPDAPR